MKIAYEISAIYCSNSLLQTHGATRKIKIRVAVGRSGQWLLSPNLVAQLAFND